MIDLYPYQKTAVSVIANACHAKQTVLCVAPCGAGKTVIFSDISRRVAAVGKRLLVLIDRKQLVRQTAERIRINAGLSDVGVICAGVQAIRDFDSLVTVASRQTITPEIRAGNIRAVDYLILDEAHLACASGGQYTQIIDSLLAMNPAMKTIGFTATPFRMYGGNIYGDGQKFSTIDVRLTAKDLISGGYILPLKWKVSDSSVVGHLESVSLRASGEYDEAEQAEILLRKTYLREVFLKWKEHCQDRKTVIFALNIAHAEALAAVFRSESVTAWITHSQNESEISTDSAISEFEQNTGVLINVGKLTIGSDIPCMSAIILARRTASPALFFQIVGRGARLFPGKKDCLIIDMCGNAITHGIDQDDPIIREKRQKKSEKKAAEKPVKNCPECRTATRKAASVCLVCGHVFKAEKPIVDESDDTVNLMDYDGFYDLRVDNVRYSKYQSKKGNLTIRADFYSKGKKRVSAWFMPDHSSLRIRKKASDFFLAMGGREPVPESISEWGERARKELKRAVVLRLDCRQKFPEIIKIE
jgi:DNA repair protein RadD